MHFDGYSNLNVSFTSLCIIYSTIGAVCRQSVVEFASRPLIRCDLTPIDRIA